MDNLRKSFLVRGNSIVGAVGDKNFSTLHVGCVIPFAGSTDNIPRGYLACDGASYPTAEYPDLYAVIGNTYGGDTENFNVPDYRETVLVGVGENTTDTIASHDVYGLGEFKDDQMQSHTHNVTVPNSVGASWQITSNPAAYYSTGTKTQTSTEAGTGTTTHGKQKGVTYIIKAFHTNEGVDSTNEVSDPIIEYVESEIAEVESEIATTNKQVQGATPFGEMYYSEYPYRKLTATVFYGRETVFEVSCQNYLGQITILVADSTSVKAIDIRGTRPYEIKYNDTTTISSGKYSLDLFIHKTTDIGTMTIRPAIQSINNYTTVYNKNNFVYSTESEFTSASNTATYQHTSINDSSTNSTSTWSSSKIAQQDGIKQVFYASSTSYPSIFWVLSDITTGVFWFKHTLSSSGGIQSVEGYADLTHNVARLISGSESDISIYVGTDETSGKKGVRLTVSWGDNATTSCKITEARPVTAIPTQIATR